MIHCTAISRRLLPLPEAAFPVTSRASIGSVAQILFAVSTVFFLLAGNACAQTPERYVVVDSTTALAHVLDASTGTEVVAVHTGASPSSVVISPNRHLAFVANLNSYYLSVLDLTIGAEIRRIRNVRLAQLALSADGRILVGTDVEGDGITVIDTETLTVKNHIVLNGLLGDNPAINGDLIPGKPVIIGNNVYLNTSHDVGVVNISTGTVIDIASTPVFFAVSLTQDTTASTADGKFVIAIRQGALLIIDASTNMIAATLPMSASTVLSISAARDASDPTKIFAYLLRDTGVDRRFSILDLSSGSASFGVIIGETVLPAGFPLDFLAKIAPNANGTRAYLSISGSAKPNVFTVDTSVATAPILVAQASVGFTLRNIAVGMIQPPFLGAGTPVPTAVTPLVSNDVARTIQISGSGFAPDSQVRIGNLDTVAAQFISPSLLQAAIPQNAAAQQASIIITNPNLSQDITSQQLSGILRNALIITNPPTFQPGRQVAVMNSGDSSFSVLNTGVSIPPTPSIFAGSPALRFAITPDGARAYLENQSTPGTVSVYNFSTNSIENNIVLDPTCTPAAQTKSIVVGPRFGTGLLTAFVLCNRRVAGFTNQDLYMIDAEPSSPTFNAVTRIPTSAPQHTITSGPLAITPDGHFAFIANFGTLIILDLSNGSSSSIPNATLGIPLGFNPNVELSSDGRFLVSSAADSRSLLVFDVTNPTAPALFTTVRGTAQFLAFPRIVRNRMFGFDNNSNMVDVFNFSPDQNNFAELATFVVPGTTSGIGGIFDVSPDSKLLYLPMREEDSVAVLDVDKIAAHDPTALLTKVAVGIAPSMAVIRPGLLVTPPPVLSVSNMQFTFGSVPVGESRELTVLITNKGGSPLLGSAIVSPPFSTVGTNIIDTAPAASQILTIHFAPSSAGPNNNTLSIVTNGGQANVALHGTGVESRRFLKGRVTISGAGMSSPLSGVAIVRLNGLKRTDKGLEKLDFLEMTFTDANGTYFFTDFADLDYIVPVSSGTSIVADNPNQGPHGYIFALPTASNISAFCQIAVSDPSRHCQGTARNPVADFGAFFKPANGGLPIVFTMPLPAGNWPVSVETGGFSTSENHSIDADPSHTDISSGFFALDFSGPCGTPILAAADGDVVVAAKTIDFGNTIVLAHADGIFSRYAHLDSMVVQLSKSLTHVTRGQLIGFMGRTGLATGNHLHFQIYSGEIQRSGSQSSDPLLSRVRLETGTGVFALSEFIAGRTYASTNDEASSSSCLH